MAVYALNLFDLAPNDDYREYSKGSRDAVEKHGGRVVAIGKSAGAVISDGASPRTAMILVEWPSAESFDAFQTDGALGELHGLRESGTKNYLWWVYESLDDLRPLFADQGEIVSDQPLGSTSPPE